MNFGTNISILTLSLILFSGGVDILISESYAESKSIEPVISLELLDNNKMEIHVEFLDVIGQRINHINYDVSATLDSQLILDDDEVHVHDGQGIHTTIPLDMISDSDTIDVEIVFRGIGLNEPYGGPVGKVFQITQNLNQSEDNSNVSELQKENRILREEIQQLKSQITQLQDKIDNLNAIIQEQISVMYKWILTR